MYKDLEENRLLNPFNKVDILGVLVDEKPSAWIFVKFPFRRSNRQITSQEKAVKSIIRMHEKFGLHVIQGDDKILLRPTRWWMIFASRKERHVPLYVSKKIATAKALKTAVEQKDDKQIGALLGFPPTAIDAYVDGSVLPYDQIPKSTETVTADEMKFLGHMLSRNNWQSEISYLPRYARKIKEIAPNFYDLYLKHE
ncbi:hypothetical protein CYG49_04055 [Candidatus Saccharibacteria bacterium]|nr:MAG: hypothetical protein CYG49_04055 [Candidatus Saccharibacteria bacterium]